MYRKDKKTEFYTELAKKENYPARSVYKLQEIDQKYKMFKNGDKVLDLGCAPGSWLLYVAQKVGEKGVVVGVDIDEIKIPEKSNIIFMKKSVFELAETDFSYKFNAVISDMAPSTTGVVFVDSGKSLELSEQAFKTAKMFLKPGGNFVCKIFDSPEAIEFFQVIKDNFEIAKRLKPKAVTKNSKEFYIIGKNFKAKK
ncbi:MAG: RlmE family RNA methyltransferase [Candidatus Staskawiczbacteria bacterium]|nr:RlmE family RNA methyltransferase [Candidatus Staskawiczbacteria bacterium]